MEASAFSRRRRRASRRHEFIKVQGRKKIRPGYLRPIQNEVGHALSGVGRVEILNDDAGTVFKREHEIVAAPLKQCVSCHKVELNAGIFDALNDRPGSGLRFCKNNICHDARSLWLVSEKKKNALFPKRKKDVRHRR